MNRTGLIVLQAIGAVSILAYPFVLLGNVMSLAAPGRTPLTSLFWILASLYPFVWIALDVISWRALSRGAVGLAFGLSSIPVAAMTLAFGMFLFSWVAFGLGTAGIGPGGLHSRTFPTNDAVIDSILVADQDLQIGHDPAGSVSRTLREIDRHANLINATVPTYGSPLEVALRNFSVSLDGTVVGQQDRIMLIRGLIARGARLSDEEAADLHASWLVRRAVFDGPVETAEENPLVWRIVTHKRGRSKPFNPLTDTLPRDAGGRPPFSLARDEMPLLNRPTRLHGTPLYAALLDHADEVCAVIVNSGGRLSQIEERDAAAAFALQRLFERVPGLRAAYTKTP